MKNNLLAAASLAAFATLASAASASPITPLAFDPALAQSKLVVHSADQINDPQFVQGASNFSGVGGLIINTDTLDAAGFVSLCTGTFISSTIVVTAAHCLDAPDINRIRFRTGAGTLNPSMQYEGFSYAVNPNWDGNLVGGADIGVIRLETAASNGEDIYGLYTGNDEFGKIHTKVGFGTTGEGTAGTSGADFLKRAGNNIYEFDGTLFDGGSDGTLLFDFDSGLAQNDVFGIIDDLFCGGLCGAHQTGVVMNGEFTEANSSPGDSGGPTFIDGLLAGITSFGITGAILDGVCGPGHIDPDSDAPGVDDFDTPVSQACTNSSFGEIAGDTRISHQLAFLNAALNGTLPMTWVPEPGMLGLFGLGAIGAIAAGRRRRSK
jgi:hypothetical protein